MKVTISDVAKLAGVSTATVSHTINNTRYVSNETKEKVYQAIGCRGLSRVDFFATYAENRVVFNEINTLPGFTSISMYPKLFDASGIPYAQLIDELLNLAVEACE